MTRIIRRIGIAALPLVFALAGCSLFTPTAATTDQINEEFTEIQSLIPMLEAGEAVATAQEVTLATTSSIGRAGIKTINAGAVFTGSDENATPKGIFEAGTANSTGWVRFPSTSTEYLSEFYGTAGNNAEFFVKPYDTDDTATATIYQVRLYIYPTFSTTVNYVFEEYLVSATDTSWALVDTDGVAAPLSYITNNTVYFDGTVEEHNVISNSQSNSTYYDTLFDDTAGSDDLDTSSTAYTFPADGGESVTLTTHTGGTGDYSAKVVSKISDTGVYVVEYYTEVGDGNGDIIKSAISYVTKEYVSGRFKISATTVRKYIEYPDGKKIVRARTTLTPSFRGTSRDSRTTTEKIDITPATSTTQTTFSSVTTTTTGTTTMNTIEVSLTETSAGSGTYEGTASYTTSRGTRDFTIALDGTASGGSLTVGGTDSSIFFPVSHRGKKDITAKLRHGGTFTGKKKGNVISGVHRGRNSTEVTSIEAGLGYIFAITGNTAQLQ